MKSENHDKKNVTITDIAQLANVSKSTVSRVLNDTTPVTEEKRKAVLDAMKRTKFAPNAFARGLASGQSLTVGVVTQNIGSPTYDAISQGILACLGDTNYSPIFADGQWKSEVGHVAVETLLGRRVDGLIIVGGSLPREEFDSLKQRLPTIVVGREISGWENQCLFVDNELAGYQATKHLIDLGHRQIAHITGIKDHQDSIRRVKGYCRALAEANIEQDPELIYEGRFDGNSGVSAIEDLLDRRKPFSAIFAANDMSAFGARLALYRRGIRVPEDISIIGFDDQAESAFATPPLTTIRQPGHEMGFAAAEALVKLISGEAYELPKLPTEIIVRESTQAPK